MQVNGSNWQTRIGSFRFPSCGQPKGGLAGTVYNAVTLANIPDVLPVAEGLTETLTVETDAWATTPWTCCPAPTPSPPVPCCPAIPSPR